jgi:hypothetical protein
MSKKIIGTWAILGICLGSFVFFQKKNHNIFSRIPASGPKKIIFLAVDGVSATLFSYGQNQLGLFKEFNNVSKHISTFPSLSDYAWNTIMASQSAFGARGRIQNAEAVYVDQSNLVVQDDIREYFRRIGQENHYMNFFDYYFNPYIESLLYFPTEKMPFYEIETIKRNLMESTDSSFTAAYIVSIDSLSHTGPRLMLPILKAIDQMIKDVRAQYKKNGVEVEFILVSDHGMAGRYKFGEEPTPLLRANLKTAAEEVGFKMTEALRDDFDIAIPMLAIGNYTGIYFKNLKHREKLLQHYRQKPWFDIATYVLNREENTQNKTLQTTTRIISSDSDAKIVMREENGIKSYQYQPIIGNPLKIPSPYFNRWLNSKETLTATQNSDYPDSLFRISELAKGNEAIMPDLAIGLNEEYAISVGKKDFVIMHATHGGLGKETSTGVVTTDNINRKLPKYIRSAEILDILALKEKFIKKVTHEGLSSIIDVENFKTEPIPTKRSELTEKRILGLINRVVFLSQFVLDIPTLSSVSKLVEDLKSKTNNFQNLTIAGLNLEDSKPKINITPDHVGIIVDLMLEYQDYEKVILDPRFLKIKTELEFLKTFEKTESSEEDFQKNRIYTEFIKKVAMKSYSINFLLNKALTIPEEETYQDSRDFKFYEQWLEDQEEINFADPKLVLGNEKKFQTLFSEIFKERKLQEELAPTSFPVFYPAHKEKVDLEHLTIVYVPGIFNDIFNNEIFGQGLAALKNNMGLRVISPPVQSNCAASFNGKIMMDYLKQDVQYRADRGLSQQKYFIIGYSKGGVDSMNAFLEDQEFVKQKILGLLAIASPLKGSEILKKADLPFKLVEALTTEETPLDCKTKFPASASVTPDALNRFYYQNEKNLVGLTRYYSLSFWQHSKDSHLWMKAAKTIAQYSTPNDGVVTVPASTFPINFNATNLGQVQADHLAGIVASNFEQQSFMEAVYLTLYRLKAFDQSVTNKFNQQVRYDYKETPREEHVANIEQILESKSAYPNSLKDADINQLNQTLKKALEGTLYEAKYFSISRDRKGTINLYYQVPNKTTDRFARYTSVGGKGGYHKSVYYSVADMKEVVEHLLEDLQLSGKNLWFQEAKPWEKFPLSSRERLTLPSNTLGYSDDFRINLRKVGDILTKSKVTPMLKAQYPKGFGIIYDHPRVVDFRQEYQFNYEDSSPLAPDDNAESGWSAILNKDNKVVAKMASKSDTTRLTSYAMRFLAHDFPRIEFNIQVNDDVKGANVLMDGTGKDDSAFQVWFTIRKIKDGQDRKSSSSDDEVKILGYYWGDEVPGISLVPGEIYENYYSKRNYFVVTLPEAKQVLLGIGKNQLGKWQQLKRDFEADIKKSFPDWDSEKVEVVSITIQHDSNDSKGNSEAIFESINFAPN